MFHIPVTFQILEYNGLDLRSATAEQAAYELAKPVENVSILAQYSPEKYNIVKVRLIDELNIQLPLEDTRYFFRISKYITLAYKNTIIISYHFLHPGRGIYKRKKERK